MFFGRICGRYIHGGLAVYFTRKKPADDKIGAVGESGDFRRRQFANLMYYNIGEKGRTNLKIKTGFKKHFGRTQKNASITMLWQDYYRRTSLNEKFYIGRQWYGVNAPDLDKPVLNFIRRSCSFLVGYDHRETA